MLSGPDVDGLAGGLEASRVTSRMHRQATSLLILIVSRKPTTNLMKHPIFKSRVCEVEDAGCASSLRCGDQKVKLSDADLLT